MLWAIAFAFNAYLYVD